MPTTLCVAAAGRLSRAIIALVGSGMLVQVKAAVTAFIVAFHECDACRGDWLRLVAVATLAPRILAVGVLSLRVPVALGQRSGHRLVAGSRYAAAISLMTRVEAALSSVLRLSNAASSVHRL